MFAKERKGTDAPSVGPEPRPGMSAELLTVGQLGELLQLSKRTLYRLSDSGAMPHGLRIGGSRRWRRTEIEDWLSCGCPRVDGKGGRNA